MKLIAVSILISLSLVSAFSFTGNSTNGTNWVATSEFEMGTMNLNRAEYVSADLNFGLTLNTVVDESNLTWFNQYINYTTGILYH